MRKEACRQHTNQAVALGRAIIKKKCKYGTRSRKETQCHAGVVYTVLTTRLFPVLCYQAGQRILNRHQGTDLGTGCSYPKKKKRLHSTSRKWWVPMVQALKGTTLAPFVYISCNMCFSSLLTFHNKMLVSVVHARLIVWIWKRIYECEYEVHFDFIAV